MDPCHMDDGSRRCEHLYRLLLLAYPRAFREEYAAEMLLTFRDAYTEASRERGLPGVLRLCCDCFVDFVKTVGMEHARRWRQRRADVLTCYALSQIALALPFTLDVAECCNRS